MIIKAIILPLTIAIITVILMIMLIMRTMRIMMTMMKNDITDTNHNTDDINDKTL